MNRRNIVVVLLGVSLALLGIGLQVSLAKDTVSRITKEELKARLNDPNVVIVDVRLGKDWKASESKITGAVRVEPADVLSLVDKYSKDKMLVFYCA
jgi:rhodanese-related sulfurtransferase